MKNNRPLSKRAADRKVVGDFGAQDGSVLDIHEDPSTKSTHQLSSGVEFPKRPNVQCKVNFIYECDRWKSLDFNCERIGRQFVRLALEGVEGQLPCLKFECAINLADDEQLQELNRHFRHKDSPTNVLSFPFNENAGVGDYEDYDSYLGDIAISLATVEREAAGQGKPLKNHYAHMVVHAMLHMMGYDHATSEEAAVMEALEVRILKQGGVPDPYVNQYE